MKVWDKREFKDLDDEVELGTRNIKIALRRLRKFARTGAPDELDLDGTIKGTAHKGYLDILMRPERHNAVKVLLFFDIGGSMDWHIKATEELFSAARTEFKHMEHFYFHNCLYEQVWKENRRRFQETTPTWDVLHTYPHDYKVVFVGDASMSPYEITAPGGSVEHYNEEPGATWLERMTRTYPACVWLNPVPETRVGLHPFDPDDAPADGRADVSADAGGARPRDAGVGAVGEAAPNALPKAPSPASGPAMLQFRRATIRRRWRRVAASARLAPAEAMLQRHHFAHRPGEIPAGGLQRAFGHGAFELFATQRRLEFGDLVLGGLLFVGKFGFQRSDAVGERGLGVLGLRQCRVPGGEGTRQRAVALHVGRAGLIGFLVFGFKLDERRLQAGNPLMQGVALGGDFTIAPFVFANLFGAGEQQLARVRHDLFERRRARLQRVEARVLAGALALVTLVDLVEGGDEAGTLDAGFVDRRFGVAQAALHGVEARLRSRSACVCRRAASDAGFVEQGLLRALFVLDHQHALARRGEIGFDRDHALVDGDQPFVEPAVLLAQRKAFAGPLRQIRIRDRRFARGWRRDRW